VGSKIVINNNIIEQINTFKNLRCFVSYQNDKDITANISKFPQITGIINSILKANHVPKHVD